MVRVWEQGFGWVACSLVRGCWIMRCAVCWGAEPAWFVENDPAASTVLARHWPGVPNHGDITTVDWDNVEPVDVLTGGFPCQDISVSGRRSGLRPGTRSGLWSHMAFAVSSLRPRLVVIENVRGLLSADAACDVESGPWGVGDQPDRPLRALGGVLGDLASYRGNGRGEHGRNDVGNRIRMSPAAIGEVRWERSLSTCGVPGLGHCCVQIIGIRSPR